MSAEHRAAVRIDLPELGARLGQGDTRQSPGALPVSVNWISTRWATPGSVLAAVAAAIGASACCAGPLVLVLLGIGGAWGSRLMALEPLQPYFIALALIFFGIAFHRLYRSEAACAPDEVFAVPAVRRRQRAIFWTVSTFAAALMAFPLYAPLFY